MIDLDVVQSVIEAGTIPLSIFALAKLIQAGGQAVSEIIWARRRDPRKP